MSCWRNRRRRGQFRPLNPVQTLSLSHSLQEDGSRAPLVGRPRAHGEAAALPPQLPLLPKAIRRRQDCRFPPPYPSPLLGQAPRRPPPTLSSPPPFPPPPCIAAVLLSTRGTSPLLFSLMYCVLGFFSSSFNRRNNTSLSFSL